MLSDYDLKHWLQKDIKQLDKLLLILSTFGGPASIASIKEKAVEAGWRIPKNANPSAVLSRSKGFAILVKGGWEILEPGKTHLQNLGINSSSLAVKQVAISLRSHLDNIQNPTTRAFTEEAIGCYEAKFYRSAIVMSWIAAVDVLHREVVKNHLNQFNAQAKAVNAKWKDAVNEDGLGRMGEEDFLNRCAAIGVLGKNQKEQLIQALKLRNGCGHPNSLRVGENNTAAHLETLLMNVFEKFSA